MEHFEQIHNTHSSVPEFEPAHDHYCSILLPKVAPSSFLFVPGWIDVMYVQVYRVTKQLDLPGGKPTS